MGALCSSDENDVVRSKVPKVMAASKGPTAEMLLITIQYCGG